MLQEKDLGVRELTLRLESCGPRTLGRSTSCSDRMSLAVCACSAADESSRVTRQLQLLRWCARASRTRTRTRGRRWLLPLMTMKDGRGGVELLFAASR